MQNPDTTSKVAYGIAITIYGLYALMSLLALIGAIAKQRGLIRGFFVFLMVHVILSIVTGSFFLYTVFQNAPASVNQCITTTTASMPRQACQKAVDIYKGLAVGIFIFVWLMEICTFSDGRKNVLTPPQGAVSLSTITPNSWKRRM